MNGILKNVALKNSKLLFLRGTGTWMV